MLETLEKKEIGCLSHSIFLDIWAGVYDKEEPDGEPNDNQL